jgi:hypothetical protein
MRNFLVPGEGIEPPRPCGHEILSLARLPVPPSGHRSDILPLVAFNLRSRRLLLSLIANFVAAIHIQRHVRAHILGT